MLPLYYAGIPIHLTAISGEGRVTMCPACGLSDQNAIQLEAGYILHAVGGESQITCYFDAVTTGWQACGIVEAHWSGTSVAFDTGGASITSCGTSCPGINLSLTGNSDFILQNSIPILY